MWDILENKKDIIAQIIGGDSKNNEADDEEVIELLMDKLIEEL